MADVCLLGVMDRLWFHQVVLFPEASSQVVSGLKDIKLPQPSSEFRQTSSNTSDLSLPDQETSSELSSNIGSQEDSTNEEDEQDKEKAGRPTTIRGSSNLRKTRHRSQSLSPSLQKGSHRRTLAYSSSTEGLQNMKSVVGRGRSLCELELEEVKGFMDLGFVFKKETISPKMVSLVPGLLRLNGEVTTTDKDDEVEEEDDDQEGLIRRRPYLSESWLIKRSDSPLLNLKVPRNYAAGNMKKHLRSWARTVASEIQQVY